jgi:hypothetical protein
MLEEPGAEHGDSGLRKAALRAPRVLRLLHHAELLHGALLPELLVDVTQPGQPAALRGGVLLAEAPAQGLHLRADGVTQRPEVAGDRLQRQRRVRPRRAGAGHCVEGRHDDLHLVAVVPVLPVHLSPKFTLYLCQALVPIPTSRQQKNSMHHVAMNSAR